MRYYPVFLDIRGKRCLVVGGGEVATRKMETLLRGGARVEVLTKTLSGFIREKVLSGEVAHAGQEYSKETLKGMTLVFVATDDGDLNQRVARDARELGISVNVADKPEFCDFILPALITRGDLMIAISTSGKSPALAKKLRQDLEAYLGAGYGPLINLLGKVRTRLLLEGRPPEENQKLLEELVYSPMLDWIRHRNLTAIESHLIQVFGPAYTLESLGWSPEVLNTDGCYLL
jgi:precorrin-2 dehydrogenase/sirohydrochlorin ferrochelatase